MSTGWPPVAVRQTVQRFPENQVVSIGRLVDPAVRTIVFPNVDTTYTVGRLNLAAGPLVLDVPDTGGRYYVIQLLDAYSNTFAYVGRRTTGSQAGSYALVPPRYAGPLPAGVKRIESPTNLVWLLGRTLVKSEADLPAATQVMSGYRVTALASWAAGGRQDPLVLPAFPPSPPLPIPTGRAFYDALAVALAESPPPPGDGCALRAFAAAGIGPARAPGPESDAVLAAAARAGGGQSAARRHAGTGSAARATMAGSSRAATSETTDATGSDGRSSRWWAWAPTHRPRRSIQSRSATLAAVRSAAATAAESVSSAASCRPSAPSGR